MQEQMQSGDREIGHVGSGSRGALINRVRGEVERLAVALSHQPLLAHAGVRAMADAVAEFASATGWEPAGQGGSADSGVWRLSLDDGMRVFIDGREEGMVSWWEASEDGGIEVIWMGPGSVPYCRLRRESTGAWRCDLATDVYEMGTWTGDPSGSVREERLPSARPPATAPAGEARGRDADPDPDRGSFSRAISVLAETPEDARLWADAFAEPAPASAGDAPKAIPPTRFPDQTGSAGPVPERVVPGLADNPCRRCGFGNRESARFCTVCGTKLEKPPEPVAKDVCAACGSQMRSGARFCGHCGAKAAG